MLLCPMANVVDVFCGAGGLSHGFLLEGFNIACGIDTDENCRYAFEKNNEAKFIHKSVSELNSDEINHYFDTNSPRVLIGCAPCQPYCKYRYRYKGMKDDKWKLIEEFSRLAEETQPDVISMENVPQLVRFESGSVFRTFVKSLKNNGYHVESQKFDCRQFGVPQARERLVLVASRHGKIKLPQPTHNPSQYETVKSAIGGMPPLRAGSMYEKDSLHRASNLSDLNLRRIRASRPGGSWREWDKKLVTSCHQKPSGKGYSCVYGRMEWDKSAPTMTTKFFGYGNGRFGHPEQDRAISLREGALLQSFPQDYEFVAPDAKVATDAIGRMIGNAVPVKLAQAIARSVKTHLQENYYG